MAMMMGTRVGGVNLYPSKLDAVSLLLNNANRIAVGTSEIYDDLSGKQGLFFENYYAEEKRETSEDLLSTNAIVERSLESARVNRESEEGEAIETAIQEVISDAEMQLQSFLEYSSSSSAKGTAKTNGPKDGSFNVWNYERRGNEEEGNGNIFATPLLNEGGGGGFFQEFFPGRGGNGGGVGGGPVRQRIYDAPRYDGTTLATQPFGTNLPMDNIPPRPNVDPNYITYTAQGLMGNFLQALT